MKIGNVEIQIDGMPKELEGKTFHEVFDAVRIKANSIIKRLKETEDLNLTTEESQYLAMAQMFKQMATGDIDDLKIGIKSPLDINT